MGKKKQQIKWLLEENSGLRDFISHLAIKLEHANNKIEFYKNIVMEHNMSVPPVVVQTLDEDYLTVSDLFTEE